jgi:hypothetical protein
MKDMIGTKKEQGVIQLVVVSMWLRKRDDEKKDFKDVMQVLFHHLVSKSHGHQNSFHHLFSLPHDP